MGAGAVAALATPGNSRADLPQPAPGTGSATLASDEAFWAEVATNYERTTGIVNLEQGYWGKMAKPVQDAYIDATRMVNAQNSYYARRQYPADAAESIHRIATALGVDEDEITLTRNATESLHALIRQYRGLTADDAVLYSDIDYPSFKKTMRWMAESNDARAVQISLPGRASPDQIYNVYRQAFDDNPDLKVMLIMHASNQHGLVVPVARIAEEARSRGIDVFCDCAQSWGLLDYKIPSLSVDWAVFNLHKWIGTPVGVGALYMRRGSLAKIAPYPGEEDPENTNIHARVHIATSNFAAMLAIPDALDFHEAIGGANKEARLRYLRQLWTNEAESMPHIELLGGSDEASWSGMGSFRVAGQASPQAVRALQLRLEEEFGVFTVVRYGLESGACIRVTPQVFLTPSDMEKLVDALRALA